MPASSNLWDGGHASLSRRRARRMSRRFAGVGVGIPASRLQEIAAGAPFLSDELVDVNFALTATEIMRQQRHAKLRRRRRDVIHWLIVAGLVLASLNLLMCMAYVFITLVMHESPL
ncbi:hypothetical protein AWB95_03225 [Mycobacterium celatum]|uniref:Uncharacterized protein n=2 Tax=Mycobacterium celatum TaxID=28045 RepID=A0A1X1RVQ2_MYCCE|nr:hypothetical protein AWB95_03225 [Mycobacterium celatum]